MIKYFLTILLKNQDDNLPSLVPCVVVVALRVDTPAPPRNSIHCWPVQGPALQEWASHHMVEVEKPSWMSEISTSARWHVKWKAKKHSTRDTQETIDQTIKWLTVISSLIHVQGCIQLQTYLCHAWQHLSKAICRLGLLNWCITLGKLKDNIWKEVRPPTQIFWLHHNLTQK